MYRGKVNVHDKYRARKHSSIKRKRSATKHAHHKKRSSALKKQKIIFKEPIIDNAKRVVTIGDLHGDYDSFIFALKKARIINSSLRWVAGDTILIQMGDVTDMKSRSNIGEEHGLEIKIYNTLVRLQEEACVQGGYVYMLIGNHEIMNVMGYLDYVADDNLKSFGGARNRMELFKPGGKMARFLTAYTYGIIKINGYIYVHGGIPPSFNYGIRTYNKLLREFLLGKRRYGMDDAFFTPFWDRTFGETTVSKTKFETVMRKYDAIGMVVGHTIQNNINQRFGGRLWRVDTGISKCFGRENRKRIQVLEFVHNQKNHTIQQRVIV